APAPVSPHAPPPAPAPRLQWSRRTDRRAPGIAAQSTHPEHRGFIKTLRLHLGGVTQTARTSEGNEADLSRHLAGMVTDSIFVRSCDRGISAAATRWLPYALSSVRRPTWVAEIERFSPSSR